MTVLYNRGVTIGRWHSYANWAATMESKTIEYPTPVTETVQVPGYDGVVDLSTVLTDGDIKYKNRKITITLILISDDGQLMRPLSVIANQVQGQRLKIIFDEDPDYYYIGRCTMKAKIDKTVAEITITVDADPYKYLNLVSTYINEVNGTAIVTYANMRKRATPTFEVTGNDVQINAGNLQTTLSPGTHIIPSLVFTEGDNVIKYTSSALAYVKVTYQEARL